MTADPRELTTDYADATANARFYLSQARGSMLAAAKLATDGSGPYWERLAKRVDMLSQDVEDTAAGKD